MPLPNLAAVPMGAIDLSKIVTPEGGPATESRGTQTFLDPSTFQTVTIENAPMDIDEAAPVIAAAFEEQDKGRLYVVEASGVSSERRAEPNRDGGQGEVEADINQLFDYLGNGALYLNEWSQYVLSSGAPPNWIAWSGKLEVVSDLLATLAAELQMLARGTREDGTSEDIQT